MSLLSLVVAFGLYWWNGSIQTPTTVPTTSTSTTVATSTAVASSTVPVTSTTGTVVTNALVTKVSDGDTIEVRIDGEKDNVKIRLLGVNTPETVDPRRPVECFGKEASNFTKAQLSNQRIRLVEDPQADNVDKYGRLLRNIIMVNGTDFNAELIKQGYAYAYLSFPLNKQRKVDLKRFEDEAKQAGRGLWGASTCKGLK